MIFTEFFNQLNKNLRDLKQRQCSRSWFFPYIADMILLSAQMDPNLLVLIGLAISIVVFCFFLRAMKQPYIIAYILAGVCLGPHGFEIVTDYELINELGSLGLILLLFFIGMEISLPNLIANWKISVLGTLTQVLISLLIVSLAAVTLDWELNRIVLMGFVISLSSTAVIIKLLQDRNELNSRVGQNVLGILLAQDILIVPMIIILSYLSGSAPTTQEVVLQIVGGVLMVGTVIWIIKRKEIKFPFHNIIKADQELQVFIAFSVCFGFSMLTAFFGLSSALGAFVAGIVVSAAKSTEWFHHSLNPFRVVFVALFFVSVGMLIDLDFIQKHLWMIIVFVLAIFSLNTFINALAIRLFKIPWRESLYTGAILAQIGEFSFILASTGYYTKVISEYAYLLCISIISLSLMFSPMWIWMWSKLNHQATIEK